MPRPGGLIRAAGPDDLGWMLALNAAHAAQTSVLDGAGLAGLVGQAFCALVGEQALLIALDETAGYASPNFAWFRARHARFVYVDRVIVGAARRGLGRALYAALGAEMAARGRTLLCCEVNVVPANPVSDAFHDALGFREVGRGVPYPGRVVRYLELG